MGNVDNVNGTSEIKTCALAWLETSMSSCYHLYLAVSDIGSIAE